MLGVVFCTLILAIVALIVARVWKYRASKAQKALLRFRAHPPASSLTEPLLGHEGLV